MQVRAAQARTAPVLCWPGMSADPDAAPNRPPSHPLPAARLAAAVRRRTAHLGPTHRALLWSIGAGFLFSALNVVSRTLTQQLHPMQAQFLRYLFGLLVMLPLVARAGLRAYRPQRVAPHFTRGAVHTLGLVLWFMALPHIPLADTTALGFTSPIFILVGATLFLKEPMRWERWVATVVGFLGVLVVVAPRLSDSGGAWHLAMLASSPVFAASFLLTKVLTRTESPEVIVLWQAITITLFSVPLAWPVWQHPSAWQWAGFALCGLLGTTGHYCLTRSLRTADISATQSSKFLDLVWASIWGWLVFSDLPSISTLAGGVLIATATLWLAGRESRSMGRGERAT